MNRREAIQKTTLLSLASAIPLTGSDDKTEVKIAMSDDLGSTFRSVITLDSPSGEDRPVDHVAVSLLNDGSAVAVWLHHRSSGTEIVGERISNAGQRSDEFTIASATDTGLGYPRSQRVGDQLIVSWSGKTGKDVKTATIRSAEY